MKKKQIKRLKKRTKFVQKNKRLFEQYRSIKGHKQSSHPLVREITAKARKKIKYSCKTANCDIAWSLYRLYLTLNNIQ